jgi:uncharacterized protein (DUF1330 family)
MSVYVIAQISITHRSTYDRYQAAFMEVMKQFKGTLLAADEQPQIEEGHWQHEKVILLSFPDTQAFRDWADSPEYQRIAVDRKAGSAGVVLLVQGIESPATSGYAPRNSPQLEGHPVQDPATIS